MTPSEATAQTGQRLRLALAIVAVLVLAAAGVAIWWLDDAGTERLVPGPAPTAHR